MSWPLKFYSTTPQILLLRFLCLFISESNSANTECRLLGFCQLSFLPLQQSQLLPPQCPTATTEHTLTVICQTSTCGQPTCWSILQIPHTQGLVHSTCPPAHKGVTKYHKKYFHIFVWTVTNIFNFKKAIHKATLLLATVACVDSQ